MEDLQFGSLKSRSHGGCVILDLAGWPADAADADAAARDLADCCRRIEWDETVRAVVLCFDGTLPTGVHPGLFAAGPEGRRSAADPVAALKQPVIAAIRGDALGFGLELAMACDIRIATEGARFGLPQVREGRMPSDGGTQRLPRLVGRGRAAWMLLTGESVDAPEACRIGLIHRLETPERLMQAATEMAQAMAAQSPLSLNHAKEALHKGLDLTLGQGIRMEMDLYLLMFSTKDRVEGIRAFQEKRKPRFEGA